MRRIVIGVRSTRAREVIISLTYSEVAPEAPPAASPSAPYWRHSRRNARLVMPAIGARTTGEPMVNRPSCSGGSTGAGAGGEIVMGCPLSQTLAGPLASD